MEEIDDIFDADILSEEVAEETELDILSENPVFEEIPNDGEFNIDGLEMGSSQPLAGDGSGTAAPTLIQPWQRGLLLIAYYQQ